MEVSLFPFLNQEDFSNLYSSVYDMENASVDDISSKKMPRIDYEDSPSKDFMSILSFFEEEPKFGHENWDFSLQSSTVQDQNRSMSVSTVEVDRERTRKSSSGRNSDGATEEKNNAGGHQRRLWVKDRSKAWWAYHNSDDCSDEEFRKAFRMSKATFNMICDELGSTVTKKDTSLRSAIPVRQRVAVCVYRLATGEPLRHVSQLFGLGISTCHKLVLDVCAAIKGVLMPKFLQWPDDNKINEIRNHFHSISGIPNVCGSIYTTHISIIAPKESAALYLNRRQTEKNQKPSYSTTLQGVVDTRGIFTDISIGWPGSMSDDNILENSGLFKRANMGALKDVWVVGNSGFPLMDWLMVPYTHQNLTWSQHAFNEKVDKIQNLAKEAFMRLKGRWSCLQKRTEVKLQDLPVVLGACCVLHNICEMRGEEMDAELRFEFVDDEMIAENGVRSVGALQVRDNLAFKVLHHGNAVPAVR